MTTPPKVRLFRVKRSETGAPEAGAEPGADALAGGAQGGGAEAGAGAVSGGETVAASPEGGAGSRLDLGENPFAPSAEDDGFGRLRLTEPVEPAAAASVEAAAPTAAEQTPAPPPAQAPAAASPPAAVGDEVAAAILAVKAEGLTSRQLRTAARLAIQHNLTVDSSEAAVVALRRMGIDPFHRSSLNDLISEEARRSRESAEAQASANAGSSDTGAGAASGAAAASEGKALARIPVTQVPARQVRGQAVAQMRQPGPAGPQPAAPQPISEGERAKEILRIQRDIARRRRRRAGALLLRLLAFVILPTVLTGYYYFAVATPLYETKAEFVIQKADGTSGSPFGSMLAGAGIAGNTDSITVQSYLASREAMLRLEGDVGFRRYFEGPTVDPLTRLDASAPQEEAYKTYTNMVKIGFDPAEGLVRMAVKAVDPALSEKQSLALIGYAEEQVDKLTSRLRGDQMKGAQETYASAEAKVNDAQNRVLDLQQRLGVLDPTAESTMVMQRVATLEGELQKKQLELGQLQSNSQPNAARVAGVSGDLERLAAAIAQERALLTEAAGAKESLAQMTGDLRIAQADLLTRQEMLAAAAAQVEAARIEANKQVRYLSIGVSPVAPDVPTWPRAFENTLIAFLLFSGIYLMLSLTASILREQLSA